MAKKTNIHAVELVRGIRDRHAELLRGKSDAEIIAFFREAARTCGPRHGTRGTGTTKRHVRPAARG